MKENSDIIQESRPAKRSIDQILLEPNLRVWTIPPVADAVHRLFSVDVCVSPDIPPKGATLCVVGGGALIDEAKVLARRHSRWERLIAVPVLYGSGAEVSPVAVTHTEGGVKSIDIDDELIPDAVCYCPQTLEVFSDERLRRASGDVWSHSLEGFWSPLAKENVRSEGASLLQALLDGPGLRDPDWFDLSARACSLQSKSSVGLIHGIAHVLESNLRQSKDYQAGAPGHASLCSTYLFPVLALHLEHSPKVRDLLTQHGLNCEALLQRAKECFDPTLYDRLLPKLQEHWNLIIRDPCTRANPMLIRKSTVGFFEGLGGRR